MAFSARTILLDMTLSIPAQGCTVLLGPSGTGKSTLVRTLAGLNDANPSMRTWGTLTYQGEPLSPTDRPALVGQKAHLLMATVQDSMIAKLPQRSSLTRVLQMASVQAFFEQTGQAALVAKLAMPVIDLPLHEQRMVAILRQALPGPALLMVDEPTVNLSPKGAQAVLAMLEILASQRAVLMVSHHLAQTRQIAHQVILIADGVVQESAAKDDFFGCPQTASAQHYLRTGSCPEFGIAGQATGQATGQDLAVCEAPPSQGEPARPSSPTMATMAGIVAAPAPARQTASLTVVQDLQRLQHFQHLQPDPSAKSVFCGPRGFVWLIGGKVAGTPLPGIVRDTRQDLQALRDVRITRLISLTEIPFDATLAATYGIQCTAVPMPDMHAPSLREAWFLCHAIDGYLQDGETVAVHCKAGLGRTGTVLGLYWIWLGGGQVSAKAAMQYVRRQEAGMIQSLEQENFLEKFAGLVAQRPAGTTILCSPHLALEADL
ncbi:MAG: ATP-binding cassette domain-containing protein [Pseudomonadota bacterium]|nr:ATP-binding cassette domain-containing protein [Pseudomonadota bacterium]